MRIHGVDHRVRAQVHTVGGLSAHADQADLLRWLGGYQNEPAICLVHGGTDAKQVCQTKIRAGLGIEALIPAPGDVLDLNVPRAALRHATTAAQVGHRG